MKFFLFSLSFLLIAGRAFGQPWTDNLPDKKAEDYTFYDYQKAFYSYWEPFNLDRGYYIDEKGNKRKASGWKQFKRREWEWETQIDPRTGEFPERSAYEVFTQWKKNHPKSSGKTADWQLLGPTSSRGGYGGVGRINAVSFYPDDENTYWIGAPAGGLWRTTDNGNSWTCLTDGNAVLGVSDIALPADYEVTHTIFIATGDRNAWDNRSIGVLKTTNGGANWQYTDLKFALSDNNMVTRLLMDTSDNQTIIAATSQGVFKTEDGGNDWSTQLTDISFVDMEFKPGDFSVLYGSTRDGQIYTSPDGGISWSEVLSLDAGRVELAVSPDDSSLVYAIAGANNNGLHGIYKSEDFGETFEQVFSGETKNLLGWKASGNDDGGQAWYDLSIAVSPQNANTILVGGVNTWRSSNGGETWDIENHWWGDGVQDVHADKHMLKFRENGDLFECNDGGVYISDDAGSSESWIDKTNGMAISQIYRLGVSQTLPGEIITGLQDNGSKVLYNNTWYDVKGGDGMECIIDYTDNTTQYATSYYGKITRTLDHWNNSQAVEPADAGDGAWITPYVMHPEDNNILYAGYADIWKTTDQGDSWVKISSINSNTQKFRSLAVAPSNPNVIYAADPYKIYKTEYGGGNWSEIGSGLPSEHITYIAVHPSNPDKVWVSLGGYNEHAVYESSDGGVSWQNISEGLPKIPANCIVRNKQEHQTDHLYLGTELGVFFKSGDEPWQLYSEGLPNVKIGEIEIYYDEQSPENSRLRAATYGRGLWETPLTEVTTGVSALASQTQMRIYPNPASGIVTFVNPYHKTVRIKVSDISGKQIIDKQITAGKNMIDLSGNDAGIYLFDIFTESDKYTERIILQ